MAGKSSCVVPPWFVELWRSLHFAWIQTITLVFVASSTPHQDKQVNYTPSQMVVHSINYTYIFLLFK
jgi:hypothetical protein